MRCEATVPRSGRKCAGAVGDWRREEIEQVLLLDEWQDERGPRDALRTATGAGEGEHSKLVVMAVQRQADLAEIVEALATPGGLASLLHGGEQ